MAKIKKTYWVETEEVYIKFWLRKSSMITDEVTDTGNNEHNTAGGDYKECRKWIDEMSAEKHGRRNSHYLPFYGEVSTRRMGNTTRR